MSVTYLGTLDVVVKVVSEEMDQVNSVITVITIGVTWLQNYK